MPSELSGLRISCASARQQPRQEQLFLVGRLLARVLPERLGQTFLHSGDNYRRSANGNPAGSRGAKAAWPAIRRPLPGEKRSKIVIDTYQFVAQTSRHE